MGYTPAWPGGVPESLLLDGESLHRHAHPHREAFFVRQGYLAQGDRPETRSLSSWRSCWPASSFSAAIRHSALQKGTPLGGLAPAGGGAALNRGKEWMPAFAGMTS